MHNPAQQEELKRSRTDSVEKMVQTYPNGTRRDSVTHDDNRGEVEVKCSGEEVHSHRKGSTHGHSHNHDDIAGKMFILTSIHDLCTICSLCYVYITETDKTAVIGSTAATPINCGLESDRGRLQNVQLHTYDLEMSAPQ